MLPPNHVRHPSEGVRMPRSRQRWLSLVALLALFVTLLAACGDDNKDTNTSSGGDNGGGAKKTVALAFVGPLTGPNAILGINIRDGMRVATEEANEKSDKYVYKIKPFDTQGDPAQAPGQKDKYIPDESIIGV